MREALIEGIVVADDEHDGAVSRGRGPLRPRSWRRRSPTASPSASVFPVVCGSALTGVGIDRLASLICEIGPSPLDRPAFTVQGRQRHDPDRAAIPTGQPLARVFKTIADPFVGRISLMEVLSGTLRPDTTLFDSRNHAEEKLHALQVMRGKETQPISTAPAGDIVAVAKLSGVLTGDTLAPKNQPVVADGPRIPHACPLHRRAPEGQG